MKTGLRRWFPPLLALAIFALVLVVINRELAGFHLRDVLAYLRQIPAHSVLTAAAATLAGYLLLSVYDVLGLRYARRPLPYRTILFNSVIAYAIGHSLGAAALTGGAVRYRLYSRSGLTGLDVATLQGFCSATTAVGLTILIGASLIAAPQAAVAELHMSQPWPAIVGIALLALIATYALWGSFNAAGFEFRGWVLRPPGPALTFAQVATGAIEISVSAAVLWSLLPVEAHVDFLSFLGIYSLAVAAGIASYLPGGIGVFESVILVALPDAPPDHVLGALLGYRVIYYLLPLSLAGIAFAGFEISSQGPRLARIQAAASRVIAPIAPQL
ncbi:MAG: lysylphosphatidylglycerol synthase domain-containing protein, partial [Steroidobacteraceae bacterium]